MTEHQPEPLIFSAWIRHLQQRLIVDELGAASRRFTHADPVFIERVFRDTNGAGIWCDIAQTTRQENCAEIALLSLNEALVSLVETHGDRLESWRWGDAHQALHRNDVLGRYPIVSLFANIWQEIPGGDNTLLRAKTVGTGDTPFISVHGAGYRGIYDFSDVNDSSFIIATGQSGHILSRHYDDLSVLWRRGEYVRLTLDPAIARGGNIGVTRLTPAAN